MADHVGRYAASGGAHHLHAANTCSPEEGASSRPVS